MLRLQILLVVTMLLPISSTLTAQVPVGEFFPVNSSTAGGQQWPAPAMAGDGSFVVLWEDVQVPNVEWELDARLFDADGTALGDQFQANTYTPDPQTFASVAMAEDGAFVVVWDEMLSQTGTYGGVFGQLFDAAGNQVMDDFQVTLDAAANARPSPDVALRDDGSFIVVWNGFGAGDAFGIRGRIFDSVGLPMGAEFRVNTYTTSTQTGPAVATLPGDGFVVVWASSYQDGSYDSIFAQRFDKLGLQEGHEFQINSYTSGSQRIPDVAVTSTGEFVVIWNDYSAQDGNDAGVFGRKFSSAGVGLGAEFRVNVSTVGHQLRPKVATLAQDRFVVVWQNVNDPAARLLASSGQPLGDEFAVTSYLTGHQQNARVAASGDRFVVVWGSLGQDGDRGGIFGRVFVDALFSDGFESGDLAAWSSSTP